MGFQLSPGVNVSEIDLTTVIPAVSTSAGALVGQFAWGPVNKRILVDSENTLVSRFGKPNNDNFVSFFSGANFLAYGNNLRVVRATATGQTNASATSTPVTIENEEDYEINYPVGTQSDAYGTFYSRYPGVLGNSIKVSVCANTSLFASWNYKGYFDSAPATSIFASNVGGANDEVHIAVIDVDGKISGTANTVLETFAHASKGSDSKTDDGSPNYYVTRVYNDSKYIYVADHPATSNTGWGGTSVGVTFANSLTNAAVTLGGGADAVPTGANYETAWDLFASGDEVDVSLLVGGNASEVSIQEYIANIAASRKDCVAFISPTRAVSVGTSTNATDIVTYRNTLSINSSYAVMDSGWKYQFDKYNNVYRYVPLNADIAGLCVNTDNVRDPWWSPAGLNRGIIKNVVKLSWNPNKTDRDTLYVAGVNPVVSFPGEGTVLYGDKTLQAKPSAFDRINVRRLFIVLEKAIARASKYTLFEFNDEFTRAQFVALVEPFLRDVKGRRGIYDYRVVCDTTNNTPEVIDGNRFVGDIYIKPARSINFIQLNFVAVRTGVEFSEIVGKF